MAATHKQYKSQVITNTKAYRRLAHSLANQINDIDARVGEVVDRATREIYVRTREYIDQEYYQKYQNQGGYFRLGEGGGFLGAIRYRTYKENGAWCGQIYFDENALTYSTQGKFLPHHIQNGSHFNQGLYDYFMYGTWPSDSGYNTVLYDQGFDGLADTSDGQIQEIVDFANQYLNQRIQTALRSAGYSLSSNTSIARK